MGRETSICSIRALEKQIKESEGDIIKFKRARNSSLNTSTRAPRNPRSHLRPEPRSGGGYISTPPGLLEMKKGLLRLPPRLPPLVRGRIANPGTVEFLGEALSSSRICPLELVPFGPECDFSTTFDGSIQDAVRSRIMQDTIRQVHLITCDGDTLPSIISSDKDGQNENIESIFW